MSREWSPSSMPPWVGSEARWEAPRESSPPAPTLGRADCACHTVDRPGYRRPGYQRKRRVPGRAADRFPRLSWRVVGYQRRLRLDRQALNAPCGLDLEPVAARCDGIGLGLTADPDAAAASCPLDKEKLPAATRPQRKLRPTSLQRAWA